MRRLPIAARTHMVPGVDYRLDCARYDECLDVASRGREFASGARCPVGCRWHEPPPVDSAVNHASSGASNYDAAIYAGAP